MDTTTSNFVRAGTLNKLKAKGRLVVHGRHRPVLLVHECGHVFALDNRCPHMGFPLDRGSVEDGILTCHWHHARFELASGCTFDLWADDVPTCPIEIRADGEIWVKPVFGYANPAGHWRQRLEDGLSHNLNLVIAKAVYGQLAAGQSPSEVVRQTALFGTRNRDGWDTGLTILHAVDVLPSVVGQMAAARGAEERTAWRQPVDLIALCQRAGLELPHLFAASDKARDWSDHLTLSESLLADDPAAIIDALTAAARDGASPADLGRALAYAAALRVARFGTANEHSDWETAHHVFTYANAIHQSLKRIGSGTPDPSQAVRGVLHGAMALYLARYLNVPPASLPGESGEGLDDLPAEAEEIRAALFDTFDRQQQVGAAARLVARHLTLGHSPDALIATLAGALLQEDAGFHAYQMLEAGVRQFHEWGNSDQGRHILIAVARYLAAHFPTQRALLQTADIAQRLMRGAELHREAQLAE
jgi:nitrite reductase/ring-hydroxylating ferredoxin subunit